MTETKCSKCGHDPTAPETGWVSQETKAKCRKYFNQFLHGLATLVLFGLLSLAHAGVDKGVHLLLPADIPGAVKFGEFYFTAIVLLIQLKVGFDLLHTFVPLPFRRSSPNVVQDERPPKRGRSH